jgi:hypothetical protein
MSTVAQVRFDNLSASSKSYDFNSKEADYTLSKMYEVDTRDHADHTFCGVMFNVANTSEQPLEYLEIQALAVRGHLGPMTVWWTKDSFFNKCEDRTQWQLCYKHTHPPSRRSYTRLEFQKTVRLLPGERCGLYVHSQLPGDQGLVYDNRRGAITMKDDNIQIESGVAHMSNRPFSPHGMYGFGWRRNRQFVGRVCYGVKYLLWQPTQAIHDRFPLSFRKAVDILLLVDYQSGYRLTKLPEHVVWYIINFLPFNWIQEGRNNNNEGIRASVVTSMKMRYKSVCRSSRSCVLQ